MMFKGIILKGLGLGLGLGLGIAVALTYLNDNEIGLYKSENSLEAEKKTKSSLRLTENNVSKLTDLSNSKTKLLILVNEIRHRTFEETITTQDYNKCQKISESILDENLSKTTVADTLIKCRNIRNRFGISEEKVAKWQSVGELLKKKGWKVILEKLQLGEIPINLSLQEGEPQHNLHTLLLMNNISDLSAYQALEEMGLKPNSKSFLMAMIRGNDHFIDFYKNSEQFYKTDDMHTTSVTQAASAGRLEYMKEFLDLGLPYKDPAKRDPLAIYLSKAADNSSSDELSNFIYQYSVSINDEHIRAAIHGKASGEIIALLNNLKGN